MIIYLSMPTKLTPALQNVVDKSAIPDGYVFVAKGDVYVTRKCRVETKESNRMVYTVWVSPTSSCKRNNYSKRGSRTKPANAASESGSHPRSTPKY